LAKATYVKDAGPPNQLVLSSGVHLCSHPRPLHDSKCTLAVLRLLPGPIFVADLPGVPVSARQRAWSMKAEDISRMRTLYFAVLVFACSAAVFGQTVPAAIYTDPPMDAKHPAAMTVLHIPSHGLPINSVVYSPAGAGLHPAIVICHGLPGNEKNLDLAQAVRRAGWNAVTFNYRGSWGSPGSYKFAQNLEDADAVLAYLREPTNATKLGIDTKRIVLAGHSMGGWVTAMTAAHDHGLAGIILISAADMGQLGKMEHEKLVAEMADNMEGLSGVTAESMANEDAQNSKAFGFTNAMAGLKDVPMLVLSADDGLAPQTDALVQAIQAEGNHNVKAIHAATDHGWSDHRIFLESTIIEWLSTLR
jgi:pimeloyl-ACP methyl ester carboxylesterase